jgi:hypothetical protein
MHGRMYLCLEPGVDARAEGKHVRRRGCGRSFGRYKHEATQMRAEGI